jgi:hypothetical protein
MGSTILLHPVFINLEQVRIIRHVCAVFNFIILPEKKEVVVTCLVGAMPSKSTPILITINKQAMDVAMMAKSATGQKFLGVPSHVNGNSTAVQITSQIRYSLLADIDVIPKSIKLFRFCEANRINTVQAPV